VRLVMWPALLGRLLFLFMPLVKTPAPYVVLIVLYHAVNSINTLGYAQVMRAVYPDDVRGRIMALVKVGMAAFWVLGSLAGGQLTQLVPFQWVFAVAGVLRLGENDRRADREQCHEGRVCHRNVDAHRLPPEPHRLGGAAGGDHRWAHVGGNRLGLAGGGALLRATRAGLALRHPVQHLRGHPRRDRALHCRGPDPLDRGAVD